MFHRSALSSRWLTLIFAVVASAFPAAALAAAPQLPLAYVDTNDVVPTGTTIHVSAGGSLQAALDAAHPGDVIELQAGASWRGTFHLRNKTTGGGWVTVRSSRHAELPPPGTRVSPAEAPLMATLVAPGVSRVIETDEGAHHYRFVGIEITGETLAATAQNNRFIQLDGEHSAGTRVIYQTTLEQVPHHLIFDRCYVHAGPEGGGDYIRGFVLNSAHTAIVDSYVSGFKSRGTDTQAIAGWNGPGPFKLQNNYLEAAAENVMFGGAVGTLPNIVPSDIEIRGNLFSKPLNWRIGDPSYAGIPWVVKNLFEIKNGQRVLVEDNIFQDHWAQAQSGWAIVTSPRVQGGRNSWAVASDVMFRNNVFRRTTAGVYIWGHDNVTTYVQSARVAFVNNVFEDLGLYVVSGAFNGVVMMLQNGIQDFTFEHNTVFNTGNILTFSHAPSDGLSTGLVIQNNIIHGGGYLVSGAGTGFGVAALDAQAPGWVFDHNVITGPWPTDKRAPHTAQWISQNNFFPNSVDEVGFVNLADGDYHLSASRYQNAGTDGRAPGADVSAGALKRMHGGRTGHSAR